MSAKPVVYKVETYIVPHVNSCKLPIQANEIDDIKIANQSNIKHNKTCENNIRNEEETTSLDNEHIEIARYLAENSKLIGVKVVKNVTNESETILDKRFYNDDNDDQYYNNENLYHYDDRHIKTQRTEFNVSNIESALYPVRQFKRINSLMSIDEASEGSETKLNDFCHHGYQNGCTAMIPPPEEVSEEVFKENWLQRIETLRQQELILREREMHLQNREREVFRKEKELRITERVLREKLRQMEQQLLLQHQKDIDNVQKRLDRVTRILECKPSDEFAKVEKLKNSQLPINPYEKDKESTKKTNLTHSKRHALSRQLGSSNTISNVNSYSSMRYKERLKVSYDDLNSTLSADIGDSSFVRTSERFNPEIYKKPHAFTRSASERRPKQKSQTTFDIEERPKHAIEEDKVLRKLSENICVSQNKDTRFQNYGLVDHTLEDVTLKSKMEHNPNNEGKSSSQHNLEIGDKLGHRQPIGALKDRPISWNEETSEWLQKKRQAYNLAIKKSIENKENKCNIVTEKDCKASKKDIKNKIFTIFR